MLNSASTSKGNALPIIGNTEIKIPTVDVVICNYNQGTFIRDAILSVQQQKYINFNCVIVDDCSTDNSLSFIQEALDAIRDPRFRLVERDQNGGQMAAMYTGFDAGAAPFIAFLDADDIWLPSFLEEHIACHMNSKINAALSCSNLAIIDADGMLLAGAMPGMSSGNPLRTEKFIQSRERVYEFNYLKFGHEVSGEDDLSIKAMFVPRTSYGWIWSATSGLLFRRASLVSIRPRRVQDFRTCADHYLAHCAHIVGGTSLIQETHGYYRIHGNNSWAKNAITGDGAALGRTLKQVKKATLREIMESPFLRKRMPPQLRKKLFLPLFLRSIRRLFAAKKVPAE